MNNGKICVSVCAETAEELIKQIKRAEELADVIEIRFDCLNESEFDSALQKISEINCRKPFLATFRPKNRNVSFFGPTKVIYKNDEERERAAAAGKVRSETLKAREDGWKKILVLENIEYIDFEWDLHYLLFDSFTLAKIIGAEPSEWAKDLINQIGNRQIIISEHFFDETPEDVDILKSYGTSAELMQIIHEHSEEKPAYPVIPKAVIPSILKIAAQANEITDCLVLMKYFETIKQNDLEFIPIAMGEAGKWTRILGLAHGAFMTYASLDTGQETAPGQVSAKDLIEVYRAKELDENTEIYGIIGGNTGYSMSPYIHNAAFKFHNLNAVFIPLQVRNLDEFIRRMVKPETREIELNFKGFAVTIPHKQNIIKHLDYLDESAKAIGAVNTVKIIDGKFYGYNTDARGFIEPLLNSYVDVQGAKVAVLGAGGAARACIYALKKVGADVTIFARDLVKAQNLADEFQVRLKELGTQNSELGTFDIVVNSTPLGTKGELGNETPATAEQIKNVQLVYDLVYNPFVTRFLREAKSANVPTIGGLAMLIAQAMEQQKIWTGKDAPVKEMSRAALQKIQS